MYSCLNKCPHCLLTPFSILTDYPTEGSGRLESFEERLSRRTSSEGGGKINKRVCHHGNKILVITTVTSI